MAILYEEALKKDLSAKRFAPVYILFGDDGYLKKQYTEKIQSALVDPDDVFNLARFDSSCDLQDVYDAVTQLPIMHDRKCVILTDYDFEERTTADHARLCTLVSEPNDTGVLILLFDRVEIDPKKNEKFKKLVAAAEKNGGRAVQLNHRRLPELVRMLTDGAAKRGCRMEPAVARYLVESAGEDINTLRHELDKLCAFLPGGNLSPETVDRVCVKTVEASVYDLSKQILAGKAEDALRTLDHLFFIRLEPMMILYAVSSSYVEMYRVYAGKKAGKTLPELAAEFGYKGREFVLERAARMVSGFTPRKFALSFQALTEADSSLKSFGAEPRVVLEQLVVRLIYILVKGESVDQA